MQTGIIKNQRVRMSGDAGQDARASLPSTSPCGTPKQVVLVDRAGEPRAIEFKCSCGEVTLVELVYEAAPQPAPRSAPAVHKERS